MLSIIAAFSLAQVGGVVALAFTFFQVLHISRQSSRTRAAAELQAQATLAQNYGRVSQQMSDINALFRAEPTWLPYFYEGIDPTPAGSKIRLSLELVCEALVDFADSVVEQHRATPATGMDWSTWENYFRFLQSNSPVLQRYLSENLDFYPDYVMAVFGLIVVRRPETGFRISAWRAREIDLADAADRALANEFFGSESAETFGLAGYPWVRTWVMDRTWVTDGTSTERASRTLVWIEVETEDSQSAKVHVRWQNEPNQHSRETLRSWVLGTLTASARLRYAVVDECKAGQTTPVGVIYELHPRRRRLFRRRHPSREPFLVPLFEPRPKRLRGA